MLANTTPDKVNKLGCFTQGCLADWSCMANKLGLIYKADRTKPIKYPCIAEVDYNPKTAKLDQHFVVALNSSYMIDPLGGVKRPINYYGKPKSYRNVTTKTQGDTMKFIREKGKKTVYLYGVKDGKGIKFPISASAASIVIEKVSEYSDLSKYKSGITIGHKGSDCPVCPSVDCPEKQQVTDIKKVLGI